MMKLLRNTEAIRRVSARQAARREQWLALSATALMVASSYGVAGEVSLPHVFSSGQRALATQVNENFSALEAGVDDNARKIAELQAQVLALQSPQRTPLSIYVAGTRVGTLLEGEDELLGISPKNYFFSLRRGSAVGRASEPPTEGELQRGVAYFAQVNCTGARYFRAPFDFDYQVRQGVVFASRDPQDSAKVYMAKGEVRSVTLQSFFNTASTPASCVKKGLEDRVDRVVAGTANDESVTGIKSDLAGDIEIRP